MLSDIGVFAKKPDLEYEGEFRLRLPNSPARRVSGPLCVANCFPESIASGISTPFPRGNVSLENLCFTGSY